MKVARYQRVDLKAVVRDVISSHTAIRDGIAMHAEKERQRRGEAVKKRTANLRLSEPVKPVSHAK